MNSRRNAPELARFATNYGIRIRVAHYPTGASKWNPVEHKLFGPISVEDRRRRVTFMVLDALPNGANSTPNVMRDAGLVER